MADPPRARLLPDGRRLHLQHGPIDLVVEAAGPHGAAAAAREAATRRFATILDELCGELPLLRSPAVPGPARAHGAVARRMEAAVAPFAETGFITPMAAVAGAVADEILVAMLAAAPLRRAYVNNGGDIALHLDGDETFRIGLVDRPDRAAGLFGTACIGRADGIGGVATSGWRGRSFSLGIADAVTVLARSAAAAAAAATVVANAVDLPGHPAVTRAPADSIQPDSDLGPRPVTRGVGELTPGEIDLAVSRGRARADGLVSRALIAGAALHLQGLTTTNSSWPGLARPSTNARSTGQERGRDGSGGPAWMAGPSPAMTGWRAAVEGCAAWL